MKPNINKFSAIILTFVLVFSCFCNATAATSVKLNKSGITLLKYHTYKLKLTGTTKKVTWKSLNKNVVTVSKNGTVTGVEAGTAKVTATVGNKKYICKVTVKEYDPDKVFTAYAYKALYRILPDTSNLEINEIRYGTYISNQEFAYFDCSFVDNSGERKQTYVHVYKNFGVAQSYYTIGTQFYQDYLILKFERLPLDNISMDRSKKMSKKTISKISKEIFLLEKLDIQKGADFDNTYTWLEL